MIFFYFNISTYNDLKKILYDDAFKSKIKPCNKIAKSLVVNSGFTKQWRIRIHHECEGRIEKSVTRIAVWHHEACRVMTNGDREGRIFYPILTRIMNSFSCSPLFVCFFK